MPLATYEMKLNHLLLEIWENLCVEKLGVKKDSSDFQPPKSWRKFYHVGTPVCAIPAAGTQPNPTLGYTCSSTADGRGRRTASKE